MSCRALTSDTRSLKCKQKWSLQWVLSCPAWQPSPPAEGAAMWPSSPSALDPFTYSAVMQPTPWWHHAAENQIMRGNKHATLGSHLCVCACVCNVRMCKVVQKVCHSMEFHWPWRSDTVGTEEHGLDSQMDFFSLRSAEGSKMFISKRVWSCSWTFDSPWYYMKCLSNGCWERQVRFNVRGTHTNVSFSCTGVVFIKCARDDHILESSNQLLFFTVASAWSDILKSPFIESKENEE